MSSSLWCLWSPKWSFSTGETVVFRWQILALRRCFKISHGCAVDLSINNGTVQTSRNSCRKWPRTLIVDGRSWWFQCRIACICSGCCYLMHIVYQEHTLIAPQHFASRIHNLELPLSRGPTKFPLISCTFPQRGVVMNPLVLSSDTELGKFVLNNDFSLLKWSLQAVLCCSEVIRPSKGTFLSHSEFSIFSMFSPALLYSGNTKCIQSV